VTLLRRDIFAEMQKRQHDDCNHPRSNPRMMDAPARFVLFLFFSGLKIIGSRVTNEKKDSLSLKNSSDFLFRTFLFSRIFVFSTSARLPSGFPRGTRLHRARVPARVSSSPLARLHYSRSRDKLESGWPTADMLMPSISFFIPNLG